MTTDSIEESQRKAAKVVGFAQARKRKPRHIRGIHAGHRDGHSC